MYSERNPLLRLLMVGLFGITLLFAGPLHAAIGMMTGPKTGTYYAIGQDIADIASKQKLQLKLRPSSGSIENLETMADRTENAALGIVQADVMAFLEQSAQPHSKEIQRKLRMVMPLYKEEIHVLARKEIPDFAALMDKRVVVGSSGSGSMMTSVNLFRLLGIKPAKLYQEDAPEAIIAVMTGRADAMIFVGGKPLPMFENLQQLNDTANADMAPLLKQVHFLPIKGNDALFEQYEAATLSSADYRYVDEDVSTLAVRSVLVTFDFTRKDTPYYRARCEQLATLGTGLVKSLEQLQRTGHSKWKEVAPARSLGLWQRDACAWPAIEKAQRQIFATEITPAAGQQAPGAENSNLERELLEMITQTTR